ncbi:DNA-binding LacI/PurR family transcriptional regulator [Psychromicrobium silvestre]|uniref:DNA-binding LacI/PurR family transcriptional regulator n=1 Tax=Psychromicrobium silvestre TaxID=1645614 RepID=A0A7Y9LV81_9MICC|nr:DNA-binding LacI/PurR family transcriptional regulator [Psychromicrobium silvestre]
MSPQTRERILAIASEMGYVASSAASGLATGRTRTVGVLAPYVSRWFFSRAIEGVDIALQENQYNLMLINLGGYGGNRERLFEHTMLRKQIDALVVLCLGLQPSELEHLHLTEIPLVAVGGPVKGFHQVCIDDYQAAQLATKHLIELGHRRIAQVLGDDKDEVDFAVPKLRDRAFEETLLAAGLRFEPGWELNGDFTVAGGVRAAAQLFDAPGEKPTAVFCASDEMALGVIMEAQRRGIRVPQELSVVGIDNHEFAEAAGLTTVAQNPVEQGRLAADMLIKELDGAVGTVRSVAAPFELLVRSSTAPPSR